MAQASPEMQRRLRATVELFHRRGYALPAPQLGQSLLGGEETAETILEAARDDAGLAVTDGIVHLAHARSLAAASLARVRGHDFAAARWGPVLREYGDLIARHCPWIESALVSGSFASGGFVEEDDIDVSLLVEDGTKHLSYLTALALTLPIARKYRAKATGREASTPFLPKIICLNVVWTDAEAFPFAREDGAMALEVFLSRPILGPARWNEVLAANPALRAHFPQVGGRPSLAPPGRPALSATGRFLRALAGGPRRRRALDTLAWLGTRAVHRGLRWWRLGAWGARTPDRFAVDHVDRLEATKRPYGILDRPGES
ncbi:MAG: hypothetical protein ACYDDF_07935 [Thermoplasmatota archaeon]